MIPAGISYDNLTRYDSVHFIALLDKKKSIHIVPLFFVLGCVFTPSGGVDLEEEDDKKEEESFKKDDHKKYIFHFLSFKQQQQQQQQQNLTFRCLRRAFSGVVCCVFHHHSVFNLFVKGIFSLIVLLFFGGGGPLLGVSYHFRKIILYLVVAVVGP